MAGDKADAQTMTPGMTFRDCAGVCPEMVAMPPGSFVMGSPATEQGRYDNEGPQHQVAINYSFAIAKYDVTRDEYAAFVSETNRPDSASCYVFDGKTFKDTPGMNWRNPGFTQTGRDPAVCVSWDDTQAYASWLGQKTGKKYRLLSEAEWEYAARAGTTTAYYWGDMASHDDANYGSDTCCSALVSGRDQWVNTSPVGSFSANAFGLYDMSGNVFQWTMDCLNETYAGAPSDGSAWQSGTCGRRILRSGSWYDNSRVIRSASRGRYNSGDRISGIGFRVARTF
jgi:formylglycine-generating enzyme required for sulfatase activity